MVTYPLTMPTSGIASTDFQLRQVQSRNRLRSGSEHATQIAPDYYEVELVTSNVMTRTARYRAWKQFGLALRGSLKTALLFDPDQPYPQNYDDFAGMTKAGGGAFTGAGEVDSVTNPYTYVISGLPANFVLLATDYIGFVKSGRYFLTALLDDVTADGSGVATVNLVSAVPPMFDAAAQVNFNKPLGEFILEDWQAPRGLEGGVITFNFKSRAF